MDFKNTVFIIQQFGSSGLLIGAGQKKKSEAGYGSSQAIRPEFLTGGRDYLFTIG
jgi:hypothetical protein